MLKDYLDNLQNLLNQGDAREESYYSHLAGLIRSFAVDNNFKNVDITILPKKTEAGNPDFRVWDGKNHITGYIEAKSPSVSNLDRIEETEQLKRYISTFPNVILTNFYEFRLYRDGELIKKVSVGRPDLAKKLKMALPVEHEFEFSDLFNTFFSYSLPIVRNAKTLALELAKRTRFLRDEVISIEMADEEKKGKKAILGNSGNDRVEKVIYCEPEERIYINKFRYFDNVKPEVWNYQIGGYQVLPKYLKDRKDRILENSKHLSRIITAINRTMDIQKQLDDIYLQVESQLLTF